MSIQDPIANLFSSINNAQGVATLNMLKKLADLIKGYKKMGKII